MKEEYIVIEEESLGSLYPLLGSGVEGSVYEYNDLVIKILNKEEVSLSKIIDRVKYLITVKIKNVIFPESIVVNANKEIIGYSMKKVTPNEYKSFFNLIECKDNNRFIDYFMSVQETMKELHKHNIYIGDFNPNNIMIDDNENPVFIDTINYATKEFDFLLKPYSSYIYEKLFGSTLSLLDNDKFMFTFLFISYLISFEDLEKSVSNIEYFKEIINKFDISEKSKKILINIFSNNNSKEYIDDVLADFKKIEHQKFDNKFGKLIKMIFQ